MRLELTTIDPEGQGTTNCATEISKMILNLPTFHWRRSLPRSDLAKQTGEISQESPAYFSKLIVFYNSFYI